MELTVSMLRNDEEPPKSCELGVSISRRGGNRLPGLPLELGVSMPRCDGSRPSAGKAGFPRPAVTTAAQVRTKSRVSMSHRAGNLCHVRGGGVRYSSRERPRESRDRTRSTGARVRLYATRASVRLYAKSWHGVRLCATVMGALIAGAPCWAWRTPLDTCTMGESPTEGAWATLVGCPDERGDHVRTS